MPSDMVFHLLTGYNELPNEPIPVEAYTVYYRWLEKALDKWAGTECEVSDFDLDWDKGRLVVLGVSSANKEELTQVP